MGFAWWIAWLEDYLNNYWLQGLIGYMMPVACISDKPRRFGRVS
jgi:hypothetical protein